MGDTTSLAHGLDPAQVEQFITDGFVRIDHAFPRELADSARAVLWKATGCRPDDSATWTQPVVRLGMFTAPPFVEAAGPTQWEADIVAFEQADSVVRRRPGGVVFVGSSSIRLWSSLADDFPGVATINRGFGGSRVRDATWYADRIVMAYQPRAVVFYSGDAVVGGGWVD